MSIKSAGEYCVILTQAEESNTWALLLCNSTGSPVETKYVNFEPSYISISKTHIVACSQETVYVWQYSKKSRISKDPTKAKIGKEIAFHVDDIPDMNKTYDKESYQPAEQIQDPITGVTNSEE
jgi:WD repeat-containing protein 35